MTNGVRPHGRPDNKLPAPAATVPKRMKMKIAVPTPIQFAAAASDSTLALIPLLKSAIMR